MVTKTKEMAADGKLKIPKNKRKKDKTVSSGME